MLPRLMTRLERWLGAAAGRAHRRPIRALVACGILMGLGGWSASRLALDTDLTELLPQSFESVKGLEKLKANFGGIGYVAVAGYDADPDALRRFADDMAPKLEALPGIRFVEYQRAASDFFQERALYYMALEDLGEVERAHPGAREVRAPPEEPDVHQVRHEEVPRRSTSRTSRSKYGGQSSRRLSGDGSAYYLDPKERMVVLLAKPEGNSTDLGVLAQGGGARSKALLAKQDLKRYGPNFKIQLTGTYKKKVDQQAQICPRPVLGLDRGAGAAARLPAVSLPQRGGGAAQPGAGDGQPGLDLRHRRGGLRFGEPADRLPGGHPGRPGHRARHPPAGPLRGPARQGRELRGGDARGLHPHRRGGAHLRAGGGPDLPVAGHLRVPGVPGVRGHRRPRHDGGDRRLRAGAAGAAGHRRRFGWRPSSERWPAAALRAGALAAAPALPADGGHRRSAVLLAGADRQRPQRAASTTTSPRWRTTACPRSCSTSSTNRCWGIRRRRWWC